MAGSAPYFGWPRDADVLGNYLLVSDTRREGAGANAIYLLDRRTNETIWSLDTDSANYEADVVLMHGPRTTIKMPINEVYVSTIVDVFLEPSTPFDTMYFNVLDNTTNDWVFGVPRLYSGRTFISLMDGHDYTLVSWANNSGGWGGGFPQDDSHLIPAGLCSSISFSILVNKTINGDDHYPGTTLLVSDNPPTVHEVDKNNVSIWSMEVPLYDDDVAVAITFISSVDYMPNGNILVSVTTTYHNLTKVDRALEIDHDGTVVWSYESHQYPFTNIHGVHDVDYIPQNDTFLIADTGLQHVIEVDRHGDVVWAWDPFQFIHFNDTSGTYVEFSENETKHSFYYYFTNPSEVWVHLNDADRLANGNTLISLRDLNLVVEVTPGGNIVWFYGDPSDSFSSGSIKWQHNPVRLKNGNTIICDSSHSRIIEVTRGKEIAWTTESYPWLGLLFPRGAERFSNGNTLISDSFNNRHIEINSSGAVLWSFPGNLAYDADRVDRFPPDIQVQVKQEAMPEGFHVNVSGQILARDFSDAWYNVYDETNQAWLLPNATSLSSTVNLVLLMQEGNYTIHLWARDTRLDCVMDSSDFNPNIAHVVVPCVLSRPDDFTPVVVAIVVSASIAGACLAIVIYKKRHAIDPVYQPKRFFRANCYSATVPRPVEGELQGGDGAGAGREKEDLRLNF